MGWRFHKSIRILPGIRINFGKKGITSATMGRGWFSTNISKKGVRHNFNLPGTGISYQTKPVPFHLSNQSRTFNPVGKGLPFWTCSNCNFVNPQGQTHCSQCSNVQSSVTRVPVLKPPPDRTDRILWSIVIVATILTLIGGLFVISVWIAGTR